MKIHSAWLQIYTIAAEQIPELQGEVDALLASFDSPNLYNKIIDYRTFHHGFLTLQELSHRDDFGWLIGSNIPAYGIIPSLKSYLSSCSNLAEANTEICRLQAIAIPACFTINMQIADDLVEINLTPVETELPNLSMIADLIMAMINSSTKTMLDENFELQKIYHIDAAYNQATLNKYSKAVLLNNNNKISIVYKRSWQRVQQKYASSSLVDLLKPVVDSELTRILPKKSITVLIDELLRASSHPLKLKLADIAQSVRQSEASIRQKLSDKKLTFTELQENYLRLEIMGLLSNPSATIESIALQLGYSERSELELSFKRWHGITPVQFRKQLHSLSHLIQKNYSDIKIDIPPLSSDLSGILDLIERQESPGMIAKEISKDLTLAAKLTGIASSAFFGAGKMQNLEDAIGRILGLRFVKNIVLMNSLIVFSSDKIDPNFNLQHFIFSTLFAELFCRKLSTKIALPDNITSTDFINAAQFGLIGQILLANGALQAKHEWTVEYNNKESLSELHHWENVSLGMNTYSVSNIILSHWGMSAGTCRLLASIGSPTRKLTELQTASSAIMVIHELTFALCRGLNTELLLSELSKMTLSSVEDVSDQFEKCLEKESELKQIASSIE